MTRTLIGYRVVRTNPETGEREWLDWDDGHEAWQTFPPCPFDEREWALGFLKDRPWARVVRVYLVVRRVRP